MIIKIKYLGYFLFFVVLRVNSFNKFKMELFSNLKKMWQEEHYYSYSHFMFLFNCQTLNDVKYIFYLWLHFSFTENSFYYHQADSFSIDLFQPFATVWWFFHLWVYDVWFLISSFPVIKLKGSLWNFWEMLKILSYLVSPQCNIKLDLK